MVGHRPGATAVRAPFVLLHLDPARPRTVAEGERRIAQVDRVGRSAGAGALTPVPATRPWRRTSSSLDSRVHWKRPPERMDTVTLTNRPIGLVAGWWSGRWPGSTAPAASPGATNAALIYTTGSSRSAAHSSAGRRSSVGIRSHRTLQPP